jgi:hypothetical protein
MTSEPVMAVLTTAWLLVVVELVNGMPPAWSWVGAIVAFVATCFAARRLPRIDTVPDIRRQRSILYGALAIAAIALVPVALVVTGAIGIAGGLIAAALVTAGGEYNLWLGTRSARTEVSVR